jgi:branched-chain amino acid transport system substrate-binding protein
MIFPSRLPLLLALFALLCGVPFSAAHSQGSIKIGFPMILSGSGAQFGVPIQKGAQMFLDELNAQGGVLGKRVELVPRDSQSQADRAARLSLDLIKKDHVDFLVGSFTSAEGLAVSEVAKAEKTLFLALGPKTDRLTSPEGLHPYVFRISSNTTIESRTAVAIVARWKVKRMATIAPDFAYGHDAVEVFIRQLKRVRPDIEIVSQQWPKLNEADYTPFIRAQKAAKPDAVFSVICCGNFNLFAKQASAEGYFDMLSGRFIGVAETGSIEYTRTMNQDYPIGIWGNAYDAFNYTPKDENSAKVHAQFQEKLKKYLNDPYPPSWSIQGYLGMQFLVAAIKKANSLDPLKVSNALAGLEMNTPFGPMLIRAKDHQLTRGEIWGKSTRSKDYPFPILSPVEYIDPKMLMD